MLILKSADIGNINKLVTKIKYYLTHVLMISDITIPVSQTIDKLMT